MSVNLALKLSLSSIALCAGFLLPAAYGQTAGGTVVTPVQVYAENAKGSHLREQVNKLASLVEARRLTEASEAATELQKKFEASFDPGMQQYTFQSTDEYLEFKRSSPRVFEWIDWGYKDCLQIQAFLAAEKRDFPAALAILAKIEAVAPMGPSSFRVERDVLIDT